MAEVNKRSAGEWVADAFDLKTVIIIVTLIVGWLGNWYSISGRVTALEVRAEQVEKRIDRDMIPRAEQEVRDSGLEKRLDSIGSTLDRIEQRLETKR